MSECSGVINIYKEKGYTSHDVVNIVRKTLGRIKTGHTGTLDPAAEGVLPVCIGKATKIADYISADTKTYRAELILGANTDTQDATGTVIETFSTDHISNNDIKTAIMSFVGEYSQTPPMYSALKVEGKALYTLAREGVEIDRKPRMVAIDSIEILDIQENKAIFEAECSKGTYIRTLCHDIGNRLECGGHMGSLLRTKVGRFIVENAIKLDEFKCLVADGSIEKHIITMEKALESYKVLYALGADKYLYSGNKLKLNCLENIGKTNLDINERFIVKDARERLIGIYIAHNGFAKPVTFLYRGNDDEIL